MQVFPTTHRTLSVQEVQYTGCSSHLTLQKVPSLGLVVPSAVEEERMPLPLATRQTVKFHKYKLMKDAETVTKVEIKWYLPSLYHSICSLNTVEQVS